MTTADEAAISGVVPILTTVEQAVAALDRAWPLIVDECRAVLGSELHYQAVIYHCLRATGVPRTQVGMNVKQWITDPVTPLFQQLDARKHELYRGGFEPIPVKSLGTVTPVSRRIPTPWKTGPSLSTWGHRRDPRPERSAFALREAEGVGGACAPRWVSSEADLSFGS